MLTIRSFCIPIGFAGLIGAALCLNVSEAQTTNWTTPASGYVHDSLTRTIRPVAGFVGSAILGPAVLDDIDWVSLAPNQKSAIVRRGGSFMWIPDLAAPAQAQSLDGIPLARQAFWSSDSNRAVFLTDSAKLIWLTNFSSSVGTASGTSPNVDLYWSLQDLAPAAARGSIVRWSILAVDPAADRVLLARSTIAESPLWIASRAVSPVPLEFSGHPVAAVFASGAATAFVADGAAHRIVRIKGLDGTPASELFIASEMYVDEPVGLALSADDTRLFIADGASTSIRMFDSSSGALTAELLADLIPLSLTPLGSTRFMLNSGGLSAQPLLFLDTAPPARVSFVPRGN